MLQARFTEALLKDMAKVPIQADRIFSQAESGRPKTEVLRMLEKRHPDMEYHFIEDKFGTLEKVGLLMVACVVTNRRRISPLPHACSGKMTGIWQREMMN